MKRTAWIVLALFLVACGSSSGGGTGTGGSSQGTGAGGTSGTGGTSGGTVPSALVGTWIFTNSAGNAGAGLTLNADYTYTGQVLQLTSANSGNDEVETGVFALGGNNLTLTPQKWTCPGPDPISTAQYTLSGNTLSISTPSGIVAFTRDTTNSMGNFVLTFGCIQSDGSFVAEPLAPVTNQ